MYLALIIPPSRLRLEWLGNRWWNGSLRRIVGLELGPANERVALDDGRLTGEPFA
jgi:hypothetical protein